MFTFFAIFESARRYCLLIWVHLSILEKRPSIPVISGIAVFSDEANQIFKPKRCLSTQECIHEGLSQSVLLRFTRMPAFSSPRHLINFNIWGWLFFREDFSSEASVNVTFS